MTKSLALILFGVLLFASVCATETNSESQWRGGLGLGGCGGLGWGAPGLGCGGLGYGFPGYGYGIGYGSGFPGYGYGWGAPIYGGCGLGYPVVGGGVVASSGYSSASVNGFGVSTGYGGVGYF